MDWKVWTTIADASAELILAVWPGADWIMSRSNLSMKMFSTHVPLTVMVFGPCGSRALKAVLTLEYTPGPPVSGELVWGVDLTGNRAAKVD